MAVLAHLRIAGPIREDAEAAVAGAIARSAATSRETERAGRGTLAHLRAGMVGHSAGAAVILSAGIVVAAGRHSTR